MSNYKDATVPVIQNPINLDLQIELIRAKLATISWIEKPYGRAFIHAGTDDLGTTKREPKVYVGEREHASVMPNDNTTGMCFFYVTSPETPTDYNNVGKKQQKEVDCSIIFWWNYHKIDKTRNEVFIEQQKKDVEAVMYTCRGQEIINIIDDDSRAIWAEFDISELGDELLLYPCGAMRYNLKLSYITDCS